MLNYFIYNWMALPKSGPSSQVCWGLCFIALFASILRGGWEERSFMSAYLLSFYISHHFWMSMGDARLYWLVVIDIIWFILVLPIALFTRRYWPLWSVGALLFEALADLILVGLHTVGPLTLHRVEWIYVNVAAATADVAAVALIAGMWIEPARRPWAWIAAPVRAIGRKAVPLLAPKQNAANVR